MVSTFPFLAERFRDRRNWRAEPNDSVQIFDEKIIKRAIAEQDIAVEVSIVRAVALALHLANTGFVADARRACQRVTQAAAKEGHDLRQMIYWDKIRTFIEQGGEDSATASRSSEVKLSQAWDMTRWSAELFRNRAPLSPTTWHTRIDPLDTLRCASLFLVPSCAPTTKDELEGLQALKYFLTIANGKPHLAHRRAQALAYAIDLAAKHGRLSEAWDLALVAIEGPNYLFPGNETSFILYPHFGPVFLQSCTQAATNEGRKAISRIRELLCMDSARAAMIPSQLEEYLQARLIAARKHPLPKMPPYAHLRELARVSRRAGDFFNMREGADNQAIADTEKRIGYVLPDEYKTLMRIANGWEGDSATLPGLSRVEDISLTTLDSPVPITPTDSSPRNPYNRDATFTAGLRISNTSSPSQLYLVRDVDLKLDRNHARAGGSAKRVKGNDGLPVDYQNGDYRVVHISRGDPIGHYAMIRSILDHAIKAYDVAAGVAEREENGSKVYRRRLPGVGGDDDQDDDEAAQSSGATEENSNVSVLLSAASTTACTASNVVPKTTIQATRLDTTTPDPTLVERSNAGVVAVVLGASIKTQ